MLRLALDQQTVIDRKLEKDQRWHTKHRLRKGSYAEEYLRYVAKSIARLEREEKTAAFKKVEAAKQIVVCVQYLMMGLGTELLPAAEELRRMLRHPSLVNAACQSITRMGPAGLVFLSDLKKGLRQQDSHCPQSKVLGLLLREKPEQIPRCFELTRSRNKVLRCQAVLALGFCGREALRPFPKIEAAARKQLAAPMETKSIGWWPVLRTMGDYEWHAWAWMLGKIAVTRATVTEFLKVTRSGNKYRTGKAIECLGRIGLDGKRVVPRLIELIDEFVEFEHQEGAQTRVTEALRSFGREAKPAIPALSRHIWMELKIFDGEPRKVPDYTVIRLLGAMGKDAKQALPALRQMKKQLSPEKLNPELGAAIGRIEGKP